MFHPKWSRKRIFHSNFSRNLNKHERFAKVKIRIHCIYNKSFDTSNLGGDATLFLLLLQIKKTFVTRMILQLGTPSLGKTLHTWFRKLNILYPSRIPSVDERKKNLTLFICSFKLTIISSVCYLPHHVFSLSANGPFLNFSFPAHMRESLLISFPSLKSSWIFSWILWLS